MGKWTLLFLPSWGTVFVVGLMVVLFTWLFLKTMHEYHEDLVKSLAVIMRNQTTSIRLLFQFILDKREPEVAVLLLRVTAIERQLGIAPSPMAQETQSLVTDERRSQIIKEIQDEIEIMKEQQEEGKGEQ